MHSDCHFHVKGTEDAKKVLAAMDRSGVERAILLGRRAVTLLEQRESNDDLAKLCSADPQRLVGFARTDPRIPGILDEILRCRESLQLTGIKMLPDHWSPADDFMMPIYAAVEKLRMPILFHSGILWGNGDSSRFCRPANYEMPIVNFPRLHVALAHIGWPWTDECIAVCNRFVVKARREQCPCRVFIDTTRGTPDVYRADAIRKAIACCGVSPIIFGSDGNDPEDFSISAQHVRLDREIFAQLGVSAADAEAILRTNIDRFLSDE